MPLTTDFNKSPYFDDYDENKKFYRILFRPSTAVQARELTQSQTIMQNQISRFGDHIFKDGSVVKGCNPTVIKNFDFVRVDDLFFGDANALITSINSNNVLVGQTSNVRAVPIVSKEGLLVNYPDTNRFYVKYLNVGANNSTTFANGETISVYNGNQDKLGTLVSNNLINSINVISTNSTIIATGQGYGLRVEDGILYHKGFFQLVDDQTIVVKDFDQSVGNTVVGFDTTEEIITENQDESLLDNALGYSNENAPGAHRLKLTPGLVAKQRTDVESSNAFFIVYEFSNISNDLIISRIKNSYDELSDVFANRTYSESGDYVTKPFLVEAIEGETSDTFAYQVSPGKGYVHGYEVDLLVSKKIETDRAITTKTAIDQNITANYGYFVYVNEFSGAADFSNLIQVDIYDTAQTRVTNRYTGAVTGTKIGTAKVKSVIRDSGTPGFASTTYRVYLTDVVITSASKSFAGNAKSLYLSSGTFGTFWADFVLENSRAVIYQGSDPGMVFPFGKKALKSLTTTETNFNYRAIQTKTMATDGTFTITTTDIAPATGGVDKLPYDSGVLGDVLEGQFVMSLQGDVYTANLTGTANAYSGNSVMRIVSNTANALFAPTEYISFYPTAGGLPVVRQVISANSMYLQLDAAPWTNGYSNAACTFRKYWPAGYTIPFTDSYIGTRQIDILSDTSFSVNTGFAAVGTLATSANVIVQYRMLRSQATPAKKDVHKNTFVKINLNTNAGGFNGPWNLGLPDVLKVKKVYAGNAAYTNATSAEITNYFTFDHGQRDDYYDHGKLLLKAQYRNTLTSTPYITVVLDHFTANLSSGRGFFSVDSYPTMNGTPDSTHIAWAEIPQYKSSTRTYDLRDSVDFRAFKVATANTSATMAGATVDPATTVSFVAGTASYAAEPDTNFSSNIEYYLGRSDLVVINSSGGLSVIKGTPSENPVLPKFDVDAMTLCSVEVAPWPSITSRENEIYKRMDYAIKTSISTNRGYTMRDIGVLDDRIKRLEYYTALNQLEQQAQNIQATDAAGNNRFKNGIYADPMNSHIYGSVTDDEYRWAIDQNYAHGRPTFIAEPVDLKYNSTLSAGDTEVHGRFVTRPIVDDELFIFQPYATKFRNNNQDIWSWNGVVSLYPPYDMNKDDVPVPASDVQIDLTQPFLDFGNAANIFGTHYGPWRSLGRWDSYWHYTRDATYTWAEPTSTTVPVGNFVTDVSIQPYIKSRTVAFIATNLKPNSKIYAYFDREPVSQYCAPGTLNTDLGGDLNAIFEAANQTGKLDSVVKKNGDLGADLVTDQYGMLVGVFVIPASQFRTGDRQFMLLDVDSLILGEDAALTKAATTFTASNISVSKQDVTITTTVPELHTTSWQEYYQVYDPIAQSFMVNAPQQQSGVYLTKIDVFFKSKDNNSGIRVIVCGMINGIPDSKTIYGIARNDGANVLVSDDASVATTFTFNNPVFLSSDREYAFYVEPETSSPEYRMWVCEMGNEDVLTGVQVSQNPYTGEMFRSSNARTWTALPREDIKFNLYVANFEVGSGYAYFENENDEYIIYDAVSLANSNISVQVGDQVWAVNTSNAVITSPASYYGVVQTLDDANKKLKLDSSTGGFSAGNKLGFFRIAQSGNTSLANSTTLIATANVVSLYNPPLHAIVPRFATSAPLGSTIDVYFQGVSNSAAIESGWNEVSLEEEKEMLDYERVVYSRSNELTALGSNKSLTIRTTLTSTNKYISPVIDLTRKGAMLIENVINNDNTKEYTRYGNAAAKYVSLPIVLADGQDAEDMKVYLSAYRPYNSDIEVYVKFKAADDPEALDTKVWTKLVNETPGLWSSPVDRFDFKEYVFNIPTSNEWSVFNVNANTAGANSTTNSISLAQASSYLTVGDKVLYTIPAGNSAIGGLTSNTYYYVSYANTSAFALANTPGGTNIAITEVRTTSPSEVHQFTGPIINRAYANTSNYNILEYYDSTGALHVTYKSFAVKIVLLADNGIYVPKINDIRGIALQV